MDITVIVSFNRDGNIFGHPKITYESAQATDNDRLHVPHRRDGDIATLHADAIYAGHGRGRGRPSVRGPVP